MSLIYQIINNFRDGEQPSCMCILLSIIVIALILVYLSWYVPYIRRKIFYFRKEKELLNTKCSTIPWMPALIAECRQRQWWEHAIIYHLLIDRFKGETDDFKDIDTKHPDSFIGGKLKGVTEKLGYIQRKGFNTIMLSPVFASNAYHGYHTIDYSNIDTNIGTWDDFDDLVTEAHQQGMRIICDYVPNHCHEKNKLFKDASAILNRGGSTPATKDWFDIKCKFPLKYTSFLSFPHLPKFNLQNDDAADYLISVAEGLIKRGVDGLRIDHIIGLPFDFIVKLKARLKAIKPDVFIFGEATMTNVQKLEQIKFLSKELKSKAASQSLDRDELQLQYVGMTDGILDFKYRDIIIEEINAGRGIVGNIILQQKLTKHFSKYPPNFTPILFLDNHDTDRFMYICKDDKSLLDEAVNFTKSLPYPVSIYYGTEQYMTNHPSIINAEPFADLRVRQPMNWYKRKFN